MSAVLDLYERRERGTTTLTIATSDGPLTITWLWHVDPHELEKARACKNPTAPWKTVLDAVSNVLDCEGAEIVGPPT